MLHLASNSSIMTDIFGGQLISSIQCQGCNQEKVTPEAFYNICLPIPNGRHQCSLNECINLFMMNEVMEDENSYECTTCKSKQNALKHFRIMLFPEVMVLHLKRYDNQSNMIETKIQFPTIDFNARSMAYDPTSMQQDHMYNLFAVCNHEGTTLNSGHYTATCYDTCSKSWYHFNDKNVTLSREPRFDESKAYILFYVKKV